MTLQDALQLAAQFHEVFGLFMAENPTASVPSEVVATRISLLREELEEYAAAAQARDLVGIADALTDLLYVLLGAYVTHGLSRAAEELLLEVHRSNMTKLDAAGRALVDEQGKVRKSPAFVAPNLEAILARYLRHRPTPSETGTT